MKGGISNVFGNFEDAKIAKQNAKIAKPPIIQFRRIPAVVRSHTKSAEGQYETNKLLLDLSQRISLGITKDRNGNKISPTVPPKYITYQMLYNECLDNRQIPRITKEEKEKLKTTFKNDKEYTSYNKSIGVKILLNETLYELERVKWWCDWYKMMKGRYSSGISLLSGQSRRVLSSSLRKAKTYGGAGARRFSPNMTSRERQERQERQNEERIQRQYRLLIPIRNGLLYAMRCFGNVAYSAATFLYWTTSLIMDSNDIDVIHDTNEEVRQEYARRQAQASEDNARRQAQAQDEDNARRQAKAHEDLLRQRQEQYERNRRPPEYYEEKFANAQRNVRKNAKEERKNMDEKIRQDRERKRQEDLNKAFEQAEAFQEEREEYERMREARQREDEIIYQEIMYIIRELFGNRIAFTQQHYKVAEEERRKRKQARIRIPWDTAQSPPQAATRAAQAAQATQAPSAIPQGLPAMNDDSNLGTLEEWDAIYKLKMEWNDINGIKSKIGKNNNTIASVMLYLYLRNNLKDTDAKLTKGHFGYPSIDALIADFKRHIFNNAYASIGEDFFKIKDTGSNVYSISRITLLRQRLNRVFFFLAKYHKCNYVGYKRSRGEGYDYANEIGLTDDEFKKILASSDGVNIPNDITKLHKKMLRKVHSDKANAGFNLQNDSGFPFIRYMEMYDNFLKWYEWYKTNPSSYINEEVKLFCPVNNNIDWDEYEEGKLHANRFKTWFD